jgi:hypothetical protein
MNRLFYLSNTSFSTFFLHFYHSHIKHFQKYFLTAANDVKAFRRSGNLLLLSLTSLRRLFNLSVIVQTKKLVKRYHRQYNLITPEKNSANHNK